MTRLNVLITSLAVSSRSGTEIVTRNLALALRKRGHVPIVYAPALGPLAEELRDCAIPVIGNIANLEHPVDIIHGQHLAPTVTAISRLPETPAIFVCHDFTMWHDCPPVLSTIQFYVAVSDALADRLSAQHGIPFDKVRVILNGVDVARFPLGPSLPAKPVRALAFANKELEHLAVIKAACVREEIEVSIVGRGVGHIVQTEAIIPQYDLVFASGLTALEALCCGRAVIVGDGRGLAGYVTKDRYPGWRRYNLGLRVLSQSLTVEAITAEIARYDPFRAPELARLVREDAHPDRWMEQFIALYEQAIAAHQACPTSRAVLDRELAKHLEAWSPRTNPAWPWMEERERLYRTIAKLEAKASPCREPTVASSGLAEARAGLSDIAVGAHTAANRDSADGKSRASHFRPPLVSIVVINFNYGEFVGTAVGSILDQTYRHFECRIIDNGSTDASVEIVHRQTQDDPRFTLIRLDANFGHLGAAVRVMEGLRGEFVLFVDADDVLFPDFLASHIQAHLASEEAVAISSSAFTQIDKDGRVLGAFGWPSRDNQKIGLGRADFVPRLPELNDDAYRALSDVCLFVPWRIPGWIWAQGSSIVYRRAILDFIRPRGSEGPLFGGVDSYFNQFCHIVNGTLLIDRPLSSYRIHGRNDFTRFVRFGSGVHHGNPAAEARNQQIRKMVIATAMERITEIEWFFNDRGVRFWHAFDTIPSRVGKELRAFHVGLADDFIANFDKFLQAFGPRRLFRELRWRLPRREFARVVTEGSGGRSAGLVWRVLRTELNYRMRRMRNKKNRRKSQHGK